MMFGDTVFSLMDLSEESYDILVCEIKESSLSSATQTMILGLLIFSRALVDGLLQPGLKIAQLRKRILGFSKIPSTGDEKEPSSDSSDNQDNEETNAQKNQKGDLTENHPEADETKDTPREQDEPSDEKSDKDSKKKKGHGRNGANAYVGAKIVSINHPSFLPGDRCPIEDCDGKVYPRKKRAVVIRVTAAPTAQATRYQLEQYRCNLCEIILRAPLPDGVALEERYDERVKASIALYKYFYGMPFKRLESIQTLFRVPLPKSTQWDLVEKVGDCGHPVFLYLQVLAANSRIIYNDDAKAKILSLVLENKQDEDLERVGIFTTAIIAHGQEYPIVIFLTGRNHSGENLDQLLQHRIEEKVILQMCDASTTNNPKSVKTEQFNCWSHVLQKFDKIQSAFPQPVEIVLTIIGVIYWIDRQAREKEMDDESAFIMASSP